MIKKFLLVLAALVLTFTLTGCTFASKAEKLEQDYAKQAEAGEVTLTLEDVKKKMGDPTIDTTVTVLGSTSGALTWVEGCENSTEVKALWSNGESAAALVVTVLNNKVTSVTYIEEYTQEKAD